MQNKKNYNLLIFSAQTIGVYDLFKYYFYGFVTVEVFHKQVKFCFSNNKF